MERDTEKERERGMQIYRVGDRDGEREMERERGME